MRSIFSVIRPSRFRKIFSTTGLVIGVILLAGSIWMFFPRHLFFRTPEQLSRYTEMRLERLDKHYKRYPDDMVYIHYYYFAIQREGKRIVPVLIDFLRDESKSKYYRYIEDILSNGLGFKALKKQTKEFVPQLIEVLEHGNKETRSYVVTILGALEDKRAIPPLINLIQDERASISIILALGRLRAKEAARPMVELLDTDYPHRGVIVKALSQIGTTEAIEGLMKVVRSEWKTGVYLEALGVDDAEITRGMAIEKLGELKAKVAVDLLIKLLLDENSWWMIREDSAQALGQIGDKRAVEPLEKVLTEDTSDSVRKAAAEALKKLTGRDYEYKR